MGDSTAEDSEAKTLQNVKDRLQFFFSDANVRQDRFIRKLLMDKEGEHKGKVPIESLLRFNTIKKYTEKAEVIVKAAKELEETLTLDEAASAIGRKVEFTSDMMNGHVPNSLHVMNLPVAQTDGGSKKYDCTVDDVKNAFQKYGDVALVKLAFSGRNKPRDADGCAMVEFATKESLEKAAEASLTVKEKADVEPKEPVTVKDSTVKVMLLSEFLEENKKNRKERDNKRGRNDGKDERESRTFKFDWKTGCVVKIKGLPEGTNREAILDSIALHLDVSVTEVKNRKIYADFSIGQTEGAVRFLEPADHVKELATKLKSGDLQIAGTKIEDAFLLEGDEEKKYYEDFIAFKNKQIRNHEEKRSRKKGRFGGRRN
eukprot:CAMPEP_0113617364 /NCGR_PEP_ID=MMETSP0017_2-20120614/8740_1 /TAXON_ID=2856 /ORGANISM="Cylindrotheca closterium" /LENGTH=371 /DNA_ID=CAMNT_0000526753 /DNA_START=78 /DNA_END=1193 /DNA_ORIENTATION=+ /assembly_acc=CAM_ASM_000147